MTTPPPAHDPAPVAGPSAGLRPVAGEPAEVVALLADWLADEHEPAPLVVETSGSTGAPKRVVLSRRAVVASARASLAHLGGGAERGRWLLALPVTYVAGLQVVVRSLLAGAPPVLGEQHETFDDAVGAVLADGRPGFCSLVPTQLAHLLDDADDTVALARLEGVLLGGGPVDPGLRNRAVASGVRVVATYGASETAGGCVYDGLPLPGADVRLVTEPDGRQRIWLGGAVLADGYLGDEQLTAETFVDGWWRTADAGRWVDTGGADQKPDRRLQVLGRLDDVIVSGGVNVPAPAVAARLREHPGVRAAEVVGVPDAEWGNRVVALVVPATRPPLSPPALDALRDFVGATMPRAWAPRTVRHLEALPLLPTGKVDRLALGSLAAGASQAGHEGGTP